MGTDDTSWTVSVPQDTATTLSSAHYTMTSATVAMTGANTSLTYPVTFVSPYTGTTYGTLAYTSGAWTLTPSQTQTFETAGTYNLTTTVQDDAGTQTVVNVALTVTPAPTITFVNTITGITIGEGINPPKLPATVGVTLSNSSTASYPVTWSSGAPTYNDAVPGTYPFTGTFILPTGVTNPNDLTASVNVIVVNIGPTPGGLSHVLSVAPLSNIIIGKGIASPSLPSNVTVALSNGTTAIYPVTWDNGSPTYNDTITGTYVFTGTLTTPVGVSANVQTAKVNVIVATNTQKDLTTWAPLPNGKTADVTISTDSNGNLSATGVPQNYTLVYYPNVANYTGLVYPVVGTNMDLPMAGDLNGGSSSTYCTIKNSSGNLENPNAVATGNCEGAALWLIPTKELIVNDNGTDTINWGNASDFLFETGLITYSVPITPAWNSSVGLTNGTATGSRTAFTATLDVPTGGTSIQLSPTTDPFNVSLTSGAKIHSS